MLSIRSVSKSFPGPRARTLLRDISLALEPGEFVAVVGESGIGKSTLLNLIAGLESPDSGAIELCGEKLGALGDDEATLLRRRHIGFVFQAFHLLPYLSVEKNVALPLVLNGVASAAIGPRVREMLGAVNLGDRATSLPAELSGGEMQRVAIARALVHRPSLVLADEPTGNLDPEAAAQVLALLRERIKADRAAGILVTHSRSAARTADRILVLSERGLSPAPAA
ncbi:MAG: ABC transporter ATP-binding protein [Burkholderiales bacterium]|nr:ABC transporter ATP-binding protein [Burkholderiales bacterium]